MYIQERQEADFRLRKIGEPVVVDKYLCKINFLFEKSVSLAGQGTEPNRMCK
jgi:hypothetical protein